MASHITYFIDKAFKESIKIPVSFVLKGGLKYG